MTRDEFIRAKRAHTKRRQYDRRRAFLQRYGLPVSAEAVVKRLMSLPDGVLEYVAEQLQDAQPRRWVDR